MQAFNEFGNEEGRAQFVCFGSPFALTLSLLPTTGRCTAIPNLSLEIEAETLVARTGRTSRCPFHQVIHCFLKRTRGRLPISAGRPRPAKDLVVTEVDGNVSN